ncbi:hypothetical protein MMC19_003136 [Ptychographa xylographoides]|nr:hypothetical protein [Ptychographa xylographoides]
MPVAEPRETMKKWPTADTAGVKISDVPTPPRMEKRLDQELRDVRTGRFRQPKHPTQQAYAPGQDQPPRALGIEDRADLDSAEECQEDVDTEDPSHGALVVGRQLMRAQVGLERPDRIGQAKTGHHASEATENDGPRLETPFRVPRRGVFFACFWICQSGSFLQRTGAGDGKAMVRLQLQALQVSLHPDTRIANRWRSHNSFLFST